MPRNKLQSEQMRSESRTKILVTARRLFAECGYDACNISDIAKQAGMSQGNIYWYFASKEALLAAVLRDAFERVAELFSQIAALPGSSRERLHALIDGYIDFGREQGGAEIIMIFVSLTAPGSIQLLTAGEFDAAQTELQVHRACTALLAQAQADAVIHSDVDPALLTMAFFAFFNGLVFSYRSNADAIPRTFIRDAVLRLLGSTP